MATRKTTTRKAKKTTRTTVKRAAARTKPAARTAAKKAPARKPARARAAEPAGENSDLRRHHSVDDYIAAKVQPPWKAVMAELRATAKTACPQMEESIKWGQPVFECNGPFAWMRAYPRHVDFGFWRGAELKDSEGLLEGSGSRMRHVKLADPENVPISKIDALIRQAVELNRQKGDPTKRAR